MNTVTDIDGNLYHSVIIGKQEWLIENLKTSKLNDGTSIQLVRDDFIPLEYLSPFNLEHIGLKKWKLLISLKIRQMKDKTPRYCWYNNDSAICKGNQGALYNWHAVNTGKLPPKGWHVPSNAEWNKLIKYLGGDNLVGEKIQVKGKSFWKPTNSRATNDSGFSALPGGIRDSEGAFSGMGEFAYWWSSSKAFLSGGLVRFMYNDDGPHGGRLHKTDAYKASCLSIRCIKN